MLHQIKLLQSPIQPPETRKHHAIPHNLTTNSPPLIPKQCSTKFSRRELTLFTNSSMLLLLTSQILDPYLVLRARAEENPQAVEPENVQPEAQTIENSQDSEIQSEAETKETPQETEGESDKLESENNETLQETEAETKGTPQETEEGTSPKGTSEDTIKVTTKRAFLDISIDKKPIGRIIIELNENTAPIGATRFSDLVSGKAGISFRRKDFVKILPNYVQHGGVRSYGVDAELASKTGRSLTNERLIEEWERLNESQGTKNLAGTVSLIIRDPSKPPPKLKLVARQGKLVVDEEEVGVEPNGTEFTIATRDSPELDSSALVIGNVIEGMDVVEKISQVKTVQENTSSPYFRVAKLIGDKRAVVAERGFNRPYSKVTITNCGLLE
ncbi:peptidyl-prolyl cis-trans isomerase CYP26-2, chloroplastic [Silene latifolia]|uniref:peptidyl-prolyl cis-trans isomerase CYP26-2, chloroplastic n=1 Tax=Silene latifolia TaxID=37657 RepID=UPI003D7824C3